MVSSVERVTKILLESVSQMDRIPNCGLNNDFGPWAMVTTDDKRGEVPLAVTLKWWAAAASVTKRSG